MRLSTYVGTGVAIGLLSKAWRSLFRRPAQQIAHTETDPDSEDSERDGLLHIITDAVPALLAYIDDDCRYQLANRTYVRWFGKNPEGTRVPDFIGPEAWEKASSQIERALAGESVEYEVELQLPRGARWVHVTYTPDRDRWGRVRGFVSLAHDVSERKAIEEERTRLYAAERLARGAAEASNRAKDQFLAVLSHELRTPLTPVLGAAAMLESNQTVADDVRRMASMIRKNAELEARLIDDLLDLTRVSRGKLSLHVEPLDAHQKLHDVLRTFESEIENKGLAVELELGASHHHVLGDHARLQQVIGNLIKNAAQYSHTGGTISIRTRNEANTLLAIDFVDEGIGIEPDMLPRLFNAFEQGQPDAPRRLGGLGLGLAISKALIEAQGGTITAASEGRDRGATFTITIPVAPPEAVALQVARAAERAGSRRILLVEDHQDTSLLLAEMLELQGYKVRTATTVADALRAASAERFDLVLSDLGLPDGTGHDLMRQLRARHHLPGVALSGFGLERDLRESIEAGFAEHLIKPVDPTTLFRALDRAMEPPQTHPS